MVEAVVAGTSALEPDHVVSFRPASFPTRERLDLAEVRGNVEFRAASITGDRVFRFPGDPTRPRPLPLARVAISSAATFFLVVAAGLAMVAVVPTLFGYGSVVVTSGSMEPAVRTSDVVITAPSDGANLGEGAVIRFDRDGDSVLHRIAQVTAQGYRTSGDANLTADSDLVLASQVTGVGVVVVPFVGLPATWADRGEWARVMLTLVTVVAAMHVSRRKWLDPGGGVIRL